MTTTATPTPTPTPTPTLPLTNEQVDEIYSLRHREDPIKKRFILSREPQTRQKQLDVVMKAYVLADYDNTLQRVDPEMSNGELLPSKSVKTIAMQRYFVKHVGLYIARTTLLILANKMKKEVKEKGEVLKRSNEPSQGMQFVGYEEEFHTYTTRLDDHSTKLKKQAKALAKQKSTDILQIRQYVPVQVQYTNNTTTTADQRYGAPDTTSDNATATNGNDSNDNIANNDNDDQSDLEDISDEDQQEEYDAAGIKRRKKMFQAMESLAESAARIADGLEQSNKLFAKFLESRTQ